MGRNYFHMSGASVIEDVPLNGDVTIIKVCEQIREYDKIIHKQALTYDGYFEFDWDPDADYVLRFVSPITNMYVKTDKLIDGKIHKLPVNTSHLNNLNLKLYTIIDGKPFRVIINPCTYMGRILCSDMFDYFNIEYSLRRSDEFLFLYSLPSEYEFKILDGVIDKKRVPIEFEDNNGNYWRHGMVKESYHTFLDPFYKFKVKRFIIKPNTNHFGGVEFHFSEVKMYNE